MKVSIEYSFGRQALCIYVRDNKWVYERRLEDGLLQARTIEQVQGKVVEPTGYLSHEVAQGLMDDLWRAGVRPKEIGTAGHLAATEKHLEDVREQNKVLFEFAMSAAKLAAKPITVAQKEKTPQELYADMERMRFE